MWTTQVISEKRKNSCDMRNRGELTFLGIGRSPRFSPNSVSRDDAILQAVAQELIRMGHSVNCVCEDDCRLQDGVDGIFNMARRRDVLKNLMLAEERGAIVLNSASALLKASRSALTSLFQQQGIPVPHTNFLLQERNWPDFPFWLKRGDACAQTVGDVRFLHDEKELETALAAFRTDDIRDLLVCEHVEGDLVKFYGVEGTDFFYYYYPTAEPGFSKFGLEQINGVPSGFSFDVENLKTYADRAARLSGLTVYGGDCIVRSDGSFLLIDFNDWPSFSPCRNDAARAIARRLVESVTR